MCTSYICGNIYWQQRKQTKNDIGNWVPIASLRNSKLRCSHETVKLLFSIRELVFTDIKSCLTVLSTKKLLIKWNGSSFASLQNVHLQMTLIRVSRPELGTVTHLLNISFFRMFSEIGDNKTCTTVLHFTPLLSKSLLFLWLPHFSLSSSKEQRSPLLSCLTLEQIFANLLSVCLTHWNRSKKDKTVRLQTVI